MEISKQLMVKVIEGEARLHAAGRVSLEQWTRSGNPIAEYPTGYAKPNGEPKLFGKLTSCEREALASEHQKLANQYEERAAYHSEQSTMMGRGFGPIGTGSK
jgi:hypothetical protein